MGNLLEQVQCSQYLDTDEKNSLAALSRSELLDGDPAPLIDQLTAFAAELFNVPIVLFSLLDAHRQWLKSRVGPDVEESLREYSFCAHAIVCDDVFEIPDARCDTRFANNPLVTGRPHIRFYAGAQVKADDHQALGVLCLIDTTPRSLTSLEKNRLTQLADIISTIVSPVAVRTVLRSEKENQFMLSPFNFFTRASRLLAEECRKSLGLGVVKLRSLVQLRNTRGFTFSERVCDEMVNALRRLSPGIVIATRIGFDRFCLIAKQYDRVDETTLNMEKLENALHVPLQVDGEDIDVQAQLLWTTSLEGLDNSQQVMNLIAELQTFSKQFSPNQRLVTCSNALLNEIICQEQFRNALPHALKAKHIYFEFQPKIDAKTLKIAGFEALMRWRHPTLGPVAPNKIVSACEDLGIEQQLVSYTLDWVFRQTATWRRNNLLGSRTVSINMSAKDLSSPLFTGTLKRLLATHELPGHYIEIELLEDGIVDNLARCVANMLESKKLGVVFSIDDFGTGFSSLSYLHQIPADILKIDKSFIDRLDQQKDSAALITAIISLAHASGMHLVAEGIETPTQAQTLRALNCDYFQGFHFQRPIPVAQVNALLEKDATYRLS
ncbi:sensor domain-containing diguanylate cyclase [Alteromonas halophila]|uniref:Sensor domain-containing phosphodiesterase n=1 Tax=Alteromonas halophila TaxID=516698 RepID=A0A918JLF1_9ALTE|nr:EAL domain-containing protein [Alteromonas halophila]GGW87950.1 sensor domain-containing phosphodiesterase [Alteromonas halophila]